MPLLPPEVQPNSPLQESAHDHFDQHHTQVMRSGDLGVYRHQEGLAGQLLSHQEEHSEKVVIREDLE